MTLDVYEIESSGINTMDHVRAYLREQAVSFTEDGCGSSTDVMHCGVVQYITATLTVEQADTVRKMSGSYFPPPLVFKVSLKQKKPLVTQAPSVTQPDPPHDLVMTTLYGEVIFFSLILGGIFAMASHQANNNPLVTVGLFFGVAAGIPSLLRGARGE